MEDLERRLELESANEGQVKEAVNTFRTSSILADQNYRLYLGKQFGEHRNYFWLESGGTPEDGIFVFDYERLMFIIDKSLESAAKQVPTLLESSAKRLEDKAKEAQHIIKKQFEDLSQYIEESMAMYRNGRIDREGSSLNVPNSKIAEDLRMLRLGILSVRGSLLNMEPMEENSTVKFVSSIYTFASSFRMNTLSDYRHYSGQITH